MLHVNKERFSYLGCLANTPFNKPVLPRQGAAAPKEYYMSASHQQAVTDVFGVSFYAIYCLNDM